MDVTRCRAFTAVLIVALMTQVLSAAMYKVGPGEDHATVRSLAASLHPGDVVEITGDIQDLFRIDSSGTPYMPIVIRGVSRVENGLTVRPRIVLNNRETAGIVCRGDWIVIEGLDISGAKGAAWIVATAIAQSGDNLTVRNCRIHHNGQGIVAVPSGAGNILIEFCEFDSNGGAKDTIALYCIKPGAQATIQHCLFTNATNGSMIRSRCSRNVIRYNWFENAYNAFIRLTDTDDLITYGEEDMPDPAQSPYPMHSDIVGNVFIQGHSPGPRWCLLGLGGEGPKLPGTEGDFNIAHNLFVTCNGGISPSVALFVAGNVDHVDAYNNVILEDGVRGCEVYQRGPAWESSRTRQFVERRGSPDPVLFGSHNWISRKATGIPDDLVSTLYGHNPRLVDALNLDLRPRKDSPLAGAGMSPLPRGQIIDLTPEFEPMRGIPVDLKPRVRRIVSPPSIGPFEVED